MQYGSDLHLARSAVVSNVWVLRDDDGRRFLIDSGHRLERERIARFFQDADAGRPGDPTALILTHRHCDHAGNAAWIRETLACPVVCHENDAPFLAGEAAPPALKRGLGNRLDEFMCSLEDKRPSRCAVDEAIGLGPWKYGFHIFPAFGHTEGSVLIYHEPSKTLFTGDALLTGVPPFRFVKRLAPAVPAFSLDVEKCRRLVLDFIQSAPPIERICSGHGPVVRKNAEKELDRYVKTFGDVER